MQHETFIAPGGTTFEAFDGTARQELTAGLSVTLAAGDTLTPEPISWLWPGWLAASKLHVFAGSPGTGKTSIAISLAAAITRGGNWPDGSMVEVPGDVLVWTGEDGVTDTLLPRFIASGGVPERVHFVTGVGDGPFDPSCHMTALADAALTLPHRPKLLILDPVVSAVAGDSHKNSEVRRGLQPVVDLAERLGCAVLGISHMSKGTAGRDPVERVCGSIAFGALARVVLAAVKPADSDAPRRLLRAKSNISPDTGGIEYTMFSAPVPGHGFNAMVIEWGEQIEGTARQLMAVEEPTPEGDSTDAADFLTEMLRDGPVPTKEVREAAAAHGHRWRTVERVKGALGIEAVKLGMKVGWAWKLPAAPLAAEDRHDDREDRHNI